MKKVLTALIVIIVLQLAGLYLAPKIESKLQQYETTKENTKVVEEAKSGIEKIPKKEIAKKEIPQSYYLEVNFICQAPLETAENWTLHEESCEEAALLQAYLFEKSEEISKEEANNVILDMIDWQRENFGGHFDLHGEQMKDFITGYYGLKESSVELIQDGEIEDIKKIVSSGHPAIVPVTGEILDNPYYPYPGYHMLIVIGYTEDHIITNDNGTKRGADFSYETEIFNAAFKDAGGEIFILNID